jgi:Domain of unknown function (DUF5658)
MAGCTPRSIVTLSLLFVSANAAIAGAASNAQLLAMPLVASSVDRGHLPEGPPISTGVVSDRLRTSQLQAIHLPPPPERPKLLVPMYISFAGLQVIDAHSTIKAVDRGYIEANPLVASSTRNRAAFVALKVAATASVIVGTERLWRHNRVAAVIAIAAINGAYAAIVAHNYRNASH